MADPTFVTPLKVLIMNSQSIMYDGEANSISSRNENGTFDILPFHINFISVIRDTITIFDTNGKKKEIPIDTGVIKVKENQVEIFLGI